MTGNNSGQTLFETYNARFMEPQQIARSFVMPPSAFNLLCKNENSILIGPRGSGKTTLMKMLRPSTLQEWKHPHRDAVISRINFMAIYIGSDSSWTNRLSMFKPESLEHRIFEILHSATIVTYALDSMLTSLNEAMSLSPDKDAAISKFFLSISDGDLELLLSQLGRLWKLEPEINSIRGLRFALQSRIQIIDDIYFNIAVLHEPMTLSDLARYGFLSIDLLTAIQTFVTVVNEIIDQPNKPWSFCIDELEIIPARLQIQLMRSFRSVSDQRIRLKISASPFSSTPLPTQDSTVPMGGHDFTPITLTYARKHEAVRFGRQMLDALIKDIAPELSATRIFGSSSFEPASPPAARAASSPYAPGGRRAIALSRLEREDPGFAAYLRRRKIDLNQLGKRSEEEKAEVRKLIQIAEIRREFGIRSTASLPTGDIVRHRSRKRVGDLYTGTESLLTICEGNPRWLIGILRPLLDNIDITEGVPRPKQARSVSIAIARYLALLSTIPFARPHHKSVPITKMIDEIGEYFFSDITALRFKTEPALSFVVDSRVKPQELESIGAALNQGAFVFVPGQENEHCVGDIVNKRFRLSYLLCPRYKLPLMYGQPVVLSRILSGRSDSTTEQYTLSDLVDEV